MVRKISLTFAFVVAVVVATQSPAALALASEDVSFVNVQGVRITGKLFRTHWSGPRPAVVMLHGCAGAYSYSDPARGIARLYTEWAERLTSVGYTALLLDDSYGPLTDKQRQSLGRMEANAKNLAFKDIRQFDNLGALFWSGLNCGDHQFTLNRIARV